MAELRVIPATDPGGFLKGVEDLLSDHRNYLHPEPPWWEAFEESGDQLTAPSKGAQWYDDFSAWFEAAKIADKLPITVRYRSDGP